MTSAGPECKCYLLFFWDAGYLAIRVHTSIYATNTQKTQPLH